MGLSRRGLLQRLGAVGGVGVAYAAMGVLGLDAHAAAGAAPALPSDLGAGRSVVILGGGIAGLVAAYELERAGFAVLKAPDIPSVLVETAFISNPEEERKLRSESYQNDLANALINGIQKYFAANPPLARNRQV